MENTSKREILLTAVLAVLVLALINPFHVLMSSMIHMVILGLLIAGTGLFVGLVVHEKVLDERENGHRDAAGRIGYTAGIILVTIGIFVQTLKGMNDPWLLLVLLGMVLSKIISRILLRKYK